VAIIKTFILVSILFILVSCGSTEETKIDCWGFSYYEFNDIHDRVYVTELVGFIIEVTYHPDSHLPYVRAGFASGGRFVDTTGNEFPHVVTLRRYFSVPWLFTSEITTTSIPTNMYSITRVQELKEHEQEMLFNPEAEALP